MTDIKWTEPPPSKRKGADRDWPKVAALLRANPGQWALVAKGSSATLAYHIRSGRLAAFREGGFESVARSITGSAPPVYDIYARYVGGDES